MSSAIMSSRNVGSATVIEFAPDTNLDAGAVDAVRDGLAAAVEQGSGGIVLDFQNVAFASSPAVGLLITLRLKAARTEHQLLLAGLNENIAGVLEVMQLTTLFQIYPTVDDALASLSGD